MSTEIKSMMKDHSLTEFWGGVDKGTCIQITSENLEIKDTVLEQIQEENFIQLTLKEALILCIDLNNFVLREITKRYK